MKKDNLKKEITILGILIGIAVAMVLVLCRFATINTDEFYTIRVVEASWSSMIDQLKVDVHPPLYYIGLKIWISIFGEGIFRMHLFSSIAFIVMALMSIWILKEFGRRAAFFYFCFLIGNPFIFQKTTELRMYDWLSMWCVLNGISIYSIIKNKDKRYWILFTVSGLGAAYTQYYGILAMICTYIGLAIALLVEKRWKDVRSFFIAGVITVIGYLPWLPTAFAQLTTVSGDYWIGAKDSRLGDIRELFVNSIPYTYHVYVAIIVLMPVAALVYLIVEGLIKKNKEERQNAWWMLTCSAGLWFIWAVGMMFIILKDRPILVSRYYVAASFLLMLGGMVFVRKLHPAIVAVLCAFFVVVGMKAYSVRIDAMLKEDTYAFIETVNGTNIEDVYYMEAGNDYIWRYLGFYLKDKNIDDCKNIDESTSYLYVEPLARIADEDSISVRKDMEKIGQYQCGEIFVTLYRKE